MSPEAAFSSAEFWFSVTLDPESPAVQPASRPATASEAPAMTKARAREVRLTLIVVVLSLDVTQRRQVDFIHPSATTPDGVHVDVSSP
ncbi:hypothetical protein GCM10010932_04730 [Agromyces flavus]|nr:hypothetical protein GCM10010932_04730 [Agromyces flavus]